MMKHIRASIAMIVVALICIGVVFIYSSSGIYALEQTGDKMFFLKRHLMFLAMGILGTLGIMSLDYRCLSRWAKPMLLVTLALLVLALIPGIGTETSGARRWFKLGPLSFQPSELAKLTMLIYAADYAARKRNKIRSLKEGFLPIMFVLGLVCALIVKQPDLGNTLLIGAVVYILLFVGGARMRHITSLFVMVSPVILALVIMVPYRMARILAFLDPWKDPQGIGFQLTQSQIALGSGGLMGVGLGKSMQKLFYLPAAHTDFILSIIGEETGLIGTSAVIFLIGAFIWQGARIAKRALDPFGYYLAVGIVAMVGLQSVINIGVSIGVFPTKGLPLPFISYGGSALIFNMIAVGLLLNISKAEDTES